MLKRAQSKGRDCRLSRKNNPESQSPKKRAQSKEKK